MKSHDCYTAKEAFTFPLICLVCLAFNIYWGCSDVWPVGAIVGTAFFGIFTSVYVFKYLRFGRDFLRIDADGITYKEWSKTTTLKWPEIAKCTLCYRHSYGGGILFYRELDISLLSETKRQKSIYIGLSGKYCLNKSVITAIEQFGGSDFYDRQSSHNNNNKYVASIFFAVIIGSIIIFAYSIIQANHSKGIIPNKETSLLKMALNTENNQPEDFSQFIEKFHSDTIFQEQRLAKSLVLFDSKINVQVPHGGYKYDAYYSWEDKDVITTLHRIDIDRLKPRCHTKIMHISDTVICENISDPDNNRLYFLEFSKQENKWLLTQLLVN